ncbi:MAG: hypothetical protein WA060_02760 [Minisyncoccia bacterium]
MDPEGRRLLEETYRLVEDNNKTLHDIKRSMMWSRVMRVIYWVFIIGSAVGAFYLLQPYIDQVKDLYSGASDILESF